MVTLLEYILTKYLGKPARTQPNGVSYWPCPVCGHQSFHTLPNKAQFKHRAKCWSVDCGFRGDAADMLKEFHPQEDWNERQKQLDRLEREWQSSVGSRS